MAKILLKYQDGRKELRELPDADGSLFNTSAEILWDERSQGPIPDEIENFSQPAELVYKEALATCYRNRMQAYPPMTDYLDAIVKDDEEYLSWYKQECLAVKARFPKPEAP